MSSKPSYSTVRMAALGILLTLLFRYGDIAQDAFVAFWHGNPVHATRAPSLPPRANMATREEHDLSEVEPFTLEERALLAAPSDEEFEEVCDRAWIPFDAKERPDWLLHAWRGEWEDLGKRARQNKKALTEHTCYLIMDGYESHGRTNQSVHYHVARDGQAVRQRESLVSPDDPHCSYVHERPTGNGEGVEIDYTACGQPSDGECPEGTHFITTSGHGVRWMHAECLRAFARAQIAKKKS